MCIISYRNFYHSFLIIYSSDFTLWPFFVDVHVVPPFRRTRDRLGVEDSRGVRINHYREASKVLEAIHKVKIPMAVASRTKGTVEAEQLINLFDWSQYFLVKEIYPGSKINHFNAIKNKLNIDYKDMIFFDDDPYNISEISELNVTCVLVVGGLGFKDLKKDLTLWPFQVDKCDSPFLKNNEGVVDRQNILLHLYPDANSILSLIYNTGISMGIASRITDISGAYQLLYNLNIRKYFNFVEIYPTRKTLHFTELKSKTGSNFEDMVFFDDDFRNIKEIKKLGVECHQVIGGVRLDYVKSVLNI